MPTKKQHVHIACFDDGHIVPRMMRWLVDGLGWSMGPYLDNQADVNYYGPYTMYGRFGQAKTKSTGWFTHRESSNPSKLAIWDNAKRNVTMPLVTTEIYQAELNATKITAGIDQDHFRPTRKKPPGKGVVGIVGTYEPRKGPELALSLKGINGVNEVLAVGGNWQGFATSRKIPYEDMPAFYAGLDLFVCTSTEEGIPAPPLEALACGVPILVPIGVGMLDELPHEQGICRYTAGDADEMVAQVGLILDGAKHDRATLRDYIVPYTIAAWVESHKAAIDKLLHM